MRRVFFLALGMLPLAACSSTGDLFKSEPPTVDLRLESEPPGAEAQVPGAGSCRTPCVLKKALVDDFSVTFTLAGYEPQPVNVHVAPAEGMFSDPTTRVDPNPVFAQLQPEPKKKPAPAKKKRKPRAAAAVPAAQPAAEQPAMTPPPSGGGFR
jgi:hypothetical protein